MLYCFCKQTFCPPLPRTECSLWTKTSPGPGSDMGHVCQPHMDVDSGYLVYSAVPNLLLDVMDLISLRGGLAFPASLPVNSDGPRFCCISCFSVAFCSENWLTECGRNILFLLHVSWLADEKWSLTAWRPPTWNWMRSWQLLWHFLCFLSMIWLYSY